MTKPHYKTTNWKHYNQALINRGSLTFWIDEEAIQLWMRIKRSVPLIPQREGAAFRECRQPRNLAVGCQKVSGSSKMWKKRYAYHKRSLSEIAMHRLKQLFGGKLSLRNYNAQVGETYAMIKTLNKLTRLGRRLRIKHGGTGRK
ncbi:hypothetical protein ABF107_004594 [Vibrio parahaemolyticus]|nr:hypothetical protein [Vibrio parahaemolyticus]EGQ8084645.1 hypothetical protein [Vibrio parahaemolyticus]